MIKIMNTIKQFQSYIFLVLLLHISYCCCAKKALITGITGQDGYYLMAFLLQKGYEVHGISRSGLGPAGTRKNSLLNKVALHILDKEEGLVSLLKNIQPDEIYNLAAQSHVGKSFKDPVETFNINSIGFLKLLEALREAQLENYTKVFQASSCELFSKNSFFTLEDLNFKPSSPYGISKLTAYWIAKSYREIYNMFICSGILFNHESPLRAEAFVSKKIVKAAVYIKHNKQDVLYLGNLDIKKDWGYAKDYVECMWLILQQEQPRDYIIATGKLHSLREFVECAFKEVGITLIWRNTKANEVGIDQSTGKVIVRINPDFYRPIEGDSIKADVERTFNILKWRPQTEFKDLVHLMVKAECELLEREQCENLK